MQRTNEYNGQAILLSDDEEERNFHRQNQIDGTIIDPYLRPSNVCCLNAEYGWIRKLE